MSDEQEGMTTKEALKHVSEHFGITSFYGLSKALSDETLTVQAIQLSNYKKGSRPSKKVAQRFFDTFGIVITDFHDTGALSK